MNNSETGDYRRQFILLSAVIFQIVGSALPQFLELGATIGERSRALDTAIVPAGWAFAIWGVIFLWSVALGLYGLTPKAARSSLMRRAAWPASGAFVASGAWGLYVQFFNFDWVSQVIIVLGFSLAVISVFAVLRERPLRNIQSFFVRYPLEIFAGWLNAATFSGAASVLMLSGVNATLPIILSLLAAAVIVAAIIVRAGAGWFYLTPIVWALAAVADKNLNGGSQPILIAATIGIGLLLLVRFTTQYSESSINAQAS